MAAWNTVEDKPNWRIETRRVGAFDEVRISTFSKASPQRLADTAFDLRAQASYVPRLKQVRILSESNNRVVAYEQVEVPIIADRDYTFELTREGDGPLYQLMLRAIDAGVAVAEGHVRMTTFRSLWTFEAGEGGTHVTLLTYGDPAGEVPAWLVRAASTQGPSDLVQAIVKRAEAK